MLSKGVFDVIGIDYAPSAIELAKKNLEEENLTTVSFETGDIAQGLKYPDQNFDLIIDNHVFHCLVDPKNRETFSPLPRAVGIAFLGLRSHFGEGGGGVRQIKPALAYSKL